MNSYQNLCKIGEGAFSTVHKVKRREDGKEYAIKKVRIMNFSEKEIESCLNEVRILASINDPHILSYKDSFYDQPNQMFCIVTEYLEGGDLFQLITKHRESKKLVSQSLIWRIACQALKGLNTLHQLSILHRDIKSANLFLNKDMSTVKLADLNVSIISYSGMAKTQAGTPFYASPEVWLEKPYNSKCDIWSLGCVLYEIAALRPPFSGEDLRSLKKNIISGTYKRIPLKYSVDLENFISLCLSTDPNERPSAKELLSNQILLKHIEQSNILNKNLVNCKLIAKILAPKKRDFRVIRNLLPKHRFEKKAHLARDENNENKENHGFWNNSQLITNRKLQGPIKRSYSLNNKPQLMKNLPIRLESELPKKLPRF